MESNIPCCLEKNRISKRAFFPLELQTENTGLPVPVNQKSIEMEISKFQQCNQLPSRNISTDRPESVPLSRGSLFGEKNCNGLQFQAEGIL